MGRKPGSKNKKTLLKNKIEIPSKEDVTINITPKEDVIIDTPLQSDQSGKSVLALRSFNLEKCTYDTFIETLKEFGGNIGIYKSYIINEIMKQYVSGIIILPNPDREDMIDYMMCYWDVLPEPINEPKDEVDIEFRNANLLVQKLDTKYILVKSYVYVDRDTKSDMMTFPNNTSYAMNKLLKLYNKKEIVINYDDFEKFKRRYKYIIKKPVSGQEW